MKNCFQNKSKTRQPIHKYIGEISEENGWKQYLDTNYWVNKNGICVNKKNKNILNPVKTENGYYRFYLYHNKARKTIMAHKVIFIAFYPELVDELEFKDINHIDGNKFNNTLDNLELITRKENIMHSLYTLKQNVKEVLQYNIDGVLLNNYPSMTKAAEAINGNVGGISQACNGKIKSYKGFIWKIK